ncbi:hypothetical protein CHUAL_000245 [Chamberlinius hualienensis]
MCNLEPPFYLIFPLKVSNVSGPNIRCDVIFGYSNSLKTSILFQSAVTLCKNQLPVVFIRPKPLQYLPIPVFGMVQPHEPTCHINNLLLVYADHFEQLASYLANFPRNIHEGGDTNKSETAMVIVDDFHHYVNQIKAEKLLEHRCAKLCCLLIEVATFCSKKRNGPVHVLVSCDKENDTSKRVKCFSRYFDGLWTVTPSQFNEQLVIEAQGNHSDNLKYLIISRDKTGVHLNKVGTKEDLPFNMF